MRNQRVIATRVMGWPAVIGWATLLAVMPARAQNSSGDHILLIGSGFLCDYGDSSACPAVVKSADGSSFEISGAGTLNANSKSVTAVGTFTHRSADGNSLETGIWVAKELVSFASYGIAPAARMQAGSAFGPPQVTFSRMPLLRGSMPAGGLAVLRIQFLPMWGPSRTAVLQANCALGKVPEEHQTEGIRLSFGGSGGDFDQEVSGRVMFVMTRLAASPAPNFPAPTNATNPAPAEDHP